jgi:hypothetical protein
MDPCVRSKLSCIKPWGRRGTKDLELSINRKISFLRSGNMLNVALFTLLRTLFHYTCDSNKNVVTGLPQVTKLSQVFESQ